MNVSWVVSMEIPTPLIKITIIRRYCAELLLKNGSYFYLVINVFVCSFEVYPFPLD